ncbi:exonuclease, DNA polymerase III, epsilon subunit family [Clostridium amylolyticum]|uniref:Exonuclease, DNA polymerase III, epsilon subunit family n=1 Tax=Clostridium amylolyticum TaxID=1121298 RepID=A0A1M6KXE9_9CLOT|nr:3'-5' exonuclease [Clostridium amylolyticum]SHJ63610.1 exonuclease, DNA polymerase III, epsilon subunit family [Clostridium amylolyticum]
MDNIAGLENELQKYNKKRIIALIIECVSVIFMLFNLTFSLVAITAFVFYLLYNSKAKKIKGEIALSNEVSNISSSNQINTNIVIENVKNDKKESSETLYIKSFEDVKNYDLGKQLDNSFIKNITRNKEVIYENFMKYPNTTKRPSNFVVFDFETTGLNEENNEIIQVGAIKFDLEKPIETFITYVKPNKKITQKITSINGITNEMVEDAPSIQEVLPRFLDFIGEEVLIAHNCTFDMKFLLHNLYKYGYKKPKNKAIDTLQMARSKIKEYDFVTEKDVKLESYKLEELKWRFNLDELKSHEALSDCKVCAYIYLEIINSVDVCYTVY